MIQCHQVNFSYENLSVLERASFRLERGEFAFIVGQSGAGKTTLLKLLYRELVPVTGHLSVLGQALSDLTTATLPNFRRKIGIVFQDCKLLNTKTVEENLELPQKIIGTHPAVAHQNVSKLLYQMGLTHRRDAHPTHISENERHRLAIARALINNPLLLLADQPTDTLDPKLALEMLALFDALNAQAHLTVLITTADSELPQKYARYRNVEPKRIIHLKDGHIY